MTQKEKYKQDTYNWQGHRGARGLLPENTIPSFIKALEFPIKALELDVVVSKDEQIIVSHEPWFSHHICTKPNGTPVTEEEERSLLLFHMDYEKIKKFDCGIRGNKRFPDQIPMKTFKPSFKDMVREVDLHCEKNNLAKTSFNIEIKSLPEAYDKAIPQPDHFVTLLLKEIELLQIRDRVNLMSFDLNILKEIKKQDKYISMSILVYNTDGAKINLERLGFLPNNYSPDYNLLNEEEVAFIHSKGLNIIPWTVNDVESMKRLILMGVDGIITDYPNYIYTVTKEL